MMRKIIPAITVVIALVITATPSHAQLFGGTCVTADGPCAGLADQILQYARQALQLEQEITTAEQEVINTIRLPGALYQDLTGKIQQIVAMASQAYLLIGNTGQFINNLNAGSYPLGILNNPMAEIVKEQNAVGNAIQALGNVIGVVNPQLATQSTILAGIQGQSFSSMGRQQTLQAATQLAATTGQDLHSLVNLTLSMAQGQHATMLADHDLRAMQYKALQVMSNVTADIPPQTGF